MRGMRWTVVLAGVLMITLLPVVAAVSPEAVPETTMPMAIAQPLTTIDAPWFVAVPIIPEPGQLVIVGSALIGLAAAVRKATKV